MGLAMRAARHIPIDRHNRSRAFTKYDQAAQMIQGGLSAVVFAEGTRSRDGRLMSFKKGPFVLALAAGVPIVPLYCENAYQLMPRRSWSPQPGTVILHVGAPIPTLGRSYEERDRLARETRAALIALGARE
jgi:1-acyl-sn-glycerol-3-phosphate acyltransferase